MTHQVVYDNETLKRLEETVGHLIDKEPLNYQEDVLSSTDSIAKDTTTDLENKFTSYPEISVESVQEFVGTPIKDDDCHIFATLNHIEHDIQESTKFDVTRNFNDGSNIVDVKQIPLPNLQEFKPQLVFKSHQNDTQKIVKVVAYIQKVPTVDIKDSNLETSVINFQQNESQKAKYANNNVMQCKIHRDQTPSTSRQTPITGAVSKEVVSFSSHNQMEDLQTHRMHQDQKTLPNYSSVIEASKPSIKCEKCDKVFSSEYSLRMHQANIHEIGDYKCEYCRKVFARHRYLRTHHMRLHTLGFFKCCVCFKLYKGINLLKTHKKDFHRIVACEITCCTCMENNTLLAKYEEISEMY